MSSAGSAAGSRPPEPIFSLEQTILSTTPEPTQVAPKAPVQTQPTGTCPLNTFQWATCVWIAGNSWLSDFNIQGTFLAISGRSVYIPGVKESKRYRLNGAAVLSQTSYNSRKEWKEPRGGCTSNDDGTAGRIY